MLTVPYAPPSTPPAPASAGWLEPELLAWCHSTKKPRSKARSSVPPSQYSWMMYRRQSCGGQGGGRVGSTAWHRVCLHASCQRFALCTTGAPLLAASPDALAGHQARTTSVILTYKRYAYRLGVFAPGCQPWKTWRCLQPSSAPCRWALHPRHTLQLRGDDAGAGAGRRASHTTCEHIFVWGSGDRGWGCLQGLHMHLCRHPETHAATCC